MFAIEMQHVGIIHPGHLQQLSYRKKHAYGTIRMQKLETCHDMLEQSFMRGLSVYPIMVTLRSPAKS